MMKLKGFLGLVALLLLASCSSSDKEVEDYINGFMSEMADNLKDKQVADSIFYDYFRFQIEQTKYAQNLERATGVQILEHPTFLQEAAADNISYEIKSVESSKDGYGVYKGKALVVIHNGNHDINMELKCQRRRDSNFWELTDVIYESGKSVVNLFTEYIDKHDDPSNWSAVKSWQSNVKHIKYLGMLEHRPKSGEHYDASRHLGETGEVLDAPSPELFFVTTDGIVAVNVRKNETKTFNYDFVKEASISNITSKKTDTNIGVILTVSAKDYAISLPSGKVVTSGSVIFEGNSFACNGEKYGVDGKSLRKPTGTSNSEIIEEVLSGAWTKGFYTDQWGEVNRSQPYIGMTSTIKTQPQGISDKEIGVGIKVDVNGFQLVIVNDYDDVDLDRFEPLTIEVKRADGVVVPICYTAMKPGNILIADTECIDHIYEAISIGSFSLSIRGYYDLSQKSFSALFKFPDTSKEFEQYMYWFTKQVQQK